MKWHLSNRFSHIIEYCNNCIDFSVAERKNLTATASIYTVSPLNYAIGAQIIQKVQEILCFFLEELRCQQKFSASIGRDIRNKYYLCLDISEKVS